MKIACIQLNIKWEDATSNFVRVRELIKKAKDGGAKLICLPELFSTGVTENSLKFSEGIDGRTSSFLSEQAKKNKVYLVGSFIEKAENNLPKNTVAVYNHKGRLIGKYEKIHLFTNNNEDEFYSAGDKLVNFRLEDFNIFPFICYDLRFPEIFRAAVEKGANVFLVMANWPNPRKEHWITLLKARAIENQSYVVGVNRVGKSPKLSFFGSSMIISPKGEIITEAGDKEEILIGEIKSDLTEEWRKSFNSLKDRRKDCYELRWKKFKNKKF